MYTKNWKVRHIRHISKLFLMFHYENCGRAIVKRFPLRNRWSQWNFGSTGPNKWWKKKNISKMGDRDSRNNQFGNAAFVNPSECGPKTPFIQSESRRDDNNSRLTHLRPANLVPDNRGNNPYVVATNGIRRKYLTSGVFFFTPVLCA